MVNSEVLLWDEKDGVVTITLNRPESLNALNLELFSDLRQGLNTVAENQDIKVALITGNGKAFSAGGDLKQLMLSPGSITSRRAIHELNHLISQIFYLEKPVIAAVNGIAVGAGFNLALICDLIYAAQSATFAQLFVKAALIPDGGGTYLLPRLVGLHVAKEMVFTGKSFSALELKEMGLINGVFSDDQLMEESLKIARQLSQGPAIALGMSKKFLNSSLKSGLEEQLEMEAFAQSLCLGTADHQEGLMAFLEKREARFKGE